MALWVEHLLCKHSDPRSDRQHPCGRCPLVCTSILLNLPPPSCKSHAVGETTGGLLDLVATSLVSSLARDPISREWGQRMGEQDASVFCCSPCLWACAPKDMCEHIIYIHTHVHTYTFIKIGKSSKSNTLRRNTSKAYCILLSLLLTVTKCLL